MPQIPWPCPGTLITSNTFLHMGPVPTIGPNPAMNWAHGAAIQHKPSSAGYIHSWDGKEEIFWTEQNPDCNAPLTYYCYQDTSSSQMICNDDSGRSRATCRTTGISPLANPTASTWTSVPYPVGPRLELGPWGLAPSPSECATAIDNPLCVHYTAYLGALYTPIAICSGAIACTANPSPFFFLPPCPWAPKTVETIFSSVFTFPTWLSTPSEPGPWTTNDPWKWNFPSGWAGAEGLWATNKGSNQTNHTTLSFDSSAPKFTAPVSNTLTSINEPAQVSFNTLTALNQTAQVTHTLDASSLTRLGRSVDLEERVNKPVTYSEAVCKGEEVLGMIPTGQTTQSTFTDYSALQQPGAYTQAPLDAPNGALEPVLANLGIQKSNLQPWRMVVSVFHVSALFSKSNSLLILVTE